MRPTDERSPFLCFVCTPASICDSRGRNVSDQTEMWLEPRQGLSRVLIGCHSQLLPRNSSHPPQQSHPSVRSLFLVHRESFPNRLAVHPYPCHNFGCHDTPASVFSFDPQPWSPPWCRLDRISPRPLKGHSQIQNNTHDRLWSLVLITLEGMTYLVLRFLFFVRFLSLWQVQAFHTTKTTRGMRLLRIARHLSCLGHEYT